MWRKQIKAERAEQQATQMMAKAKALKDAIMTRPTSSGNEGSPSEDVSENEGGGDSHSTTLATLASKALAQKPEAYRTNSSSSSGSTFGDGSVNNDHKPDGDDTSHDSGTAVATLAEAEARDAQDDACQAEQEQPREGDPAYTLPNP